MRVLTRHRGRHATGRHLVLAAVIAALLAPGLALAQDEPRPSRPAADLVAAAKTTHRKVQGPLRSALPLPLGSPATSLPTQPGLNLIDATGRTAVRIRTDVPAAIIALLRSLGRDPANVTSGSVEAYLSPQELLTVEAAPEVLNIRAVDTMSPRAVTQGRVVHNASNWQSGGVTGAGVRVGIIDSFDGITSLLGIELPSSVVAQCYTAVGVFSSNLADCDTDNVHGTAVAETIHDMAPGAQLFIANPVSRADFQQAVNWMVSNGVSIINFSAVYTWDGPGDGTSPEPDSPLRGVDDAVAGGALFVSAAGNDYRASWLGPWRDTDANDVAEFGTGVATEQNHVSLSSGERISVQLRWDDSWTASSRDIDVYLRNSNGTIVAGSAAPQEGVAGDQPFEFFSYQVPANLGGSYSIEVEHYAGALPAWIQLQTFSTQTLQYYTGGGSIGSPAESANPGMLAAGAAAWSTTSTIEGFSSQGPTPDGRVKPDIVGADRGDTVTYGPGGFGGTSQATPHIVGLAALVKQASPSYSPTVLASYLKSHALPRGTQPNNTWGAGFAHLPNICDFSLDRTSATVGAAGGSLGVLVTTSSPCSWTATSNASWLSITAGAARTGSGAVSITAAANTGAARSGTVTIAGITVTVTQNGVAVQPEPRNLQGFVVGRTVSFSWDGPLGITATAYILEAGTGPGLANIVTAPLSAARTFATTAPDGIYYVRVRSVTSMGTSAPSNEVIVTVPSPPPTAPLSLQALVQGSVVSFTWTPGPGAAPASYVLEAGSSPGLSDIGAFPISGTTFVVPGVPPGTYFVRVRALNSSGISAPSNEVPVVVAPLQPPGPPINLTGSAAGSNVSLFWQPPASGGAPAGYVLIVGSAPGAANILVLPLPLSTSLAAADVPAGTYYVRIAASNASGVGAASNEVILSVP